MKIKGKFNVGDKVFAMYDNKVVEFTLQRTVITLEKHKPMIAEYRLETDEFDLNEDAKVIITTNDKILFGTKKELIESL